MLGFLGLMLYFELRAEIGQIGRNPDRETDRFERRTDRQTDKQTKCVEEPEEGRVIIKHNTYFVAVLYIVYLPTVVSFL